MAKGGERGAEEGCELAFPPPGGGRGKGARVLVQGFVQESEEAMGWAFFELLGWAF